VTPRTDECELDEFDALFYCAFMVPLIEVD
jgi:hypothetical protein